MEGEHFCLDGFPEWKANIGLDFACLDFKLRFCFDGFPASRALALRFQHPIENAF
jgi:hypothetical protein